MTPFYWILIGFGAILLLFMLMYNSLISKRNMAENAFGGIDAMLKKRYDLIPNLVAAVKGYMQHEQSLLTQVTELRGKAMKENIPTNEKVDLDNQIGGLLRGIFVRVENYPNLKASENMLHLQASLNEIEEQISAARRAFNAAINDYNNAVQMFPTTIVASIIGMKRRNFFEIAEEERKKTEVNI